MTTTPSSPHVPLDAGRVQPSDDDEIAYWCGELGCTEAALRAAIAAVGTHVAALREHLARHPRGPAS